MKRAMNLDYNTYNTEVLGFYYDNKGFNLTCPKLEENYGEYMLETKENKYRKRYRFIS